MRKLSVTHADDCRPVRMPEEAFDRQMFSENYRMFLIVLLFLVVGVEGFVGLMQQVAVVSVAGLVGCLAGAFLAAPLFWETDNSGRLVRRVRRAAYFPISIRRFAGSKIKRMGMYGGILWLFSLAIQLVFGPLFGFGNILLYQGALAAVFVGNMIFYIIIGTVGARLGE